MRGSGPPLGRNRARPRRGTPKAIEACRHADRVAKRSVEAQEKLLLAQTEGSYWMEPLEASADALANETATLLILEHQRCQEAHGVNRAVWIARRGEVWTPYSAAETTKWLIEAVVSDQACRAARSV